MADAFAASARAASVLSGVFPYRELPPTGMALKTPRVTTSATVVPQATENAAVSDTDIVESLITNPIGTISGQQDLRSSSTTAAIRRWPTSCSRKSSGARSERPSTSRS